MRSVRRVAALLLVFGVALAAVGAPQGTRPGVAAGQFVLRMPGIAADSATGTAPGSPPAPESGRFVRFDIDIHAQELAATAGGTLPVYIQAIVEVPLPGTGEPPNARMAQFTITPEGSDSAGCTWDREDVQSIMTVRVYPSGSTDVLASFESPTWHYLVACPNVGQVSRSPAFGEESLELFLREIMAIYFTNEVPQGVRIPMEPGSEPLGCLTRKQFIEGTGLQATRARVAIRVYRDGCTPEPLGEFPDDLAPLTP